MSAQVIEIAQDRLLALCNTYPVDGRVSWHSPSARGFASMNCYLIQEDEDALLVDTGVTVHEASLKAQIGASLREPCTLSMFALRQGEFDSVCNVLPLIDRFGIRTVYGQFADAPRWADIHSEFDAADGGGDDLPVVTTVVVPRTDTIQLGRAGTRRLAVFRPALRLLTTHWIYDEATGTLFTSDSFGYVVRPSEAGPWLVTAEHDDVTTEDVCDHLANTRYWWLAHSRVDDVRRDLASIFERHDVRVIAPAFGAVLSGESVVRRHAALMDESIARLGRGAVSATGGA
ncbi:MAG TPA: hypothetical protein VK631_25760 [Solirubrobacteraceae bacterium]|nr:hypothetical protein [Solirubrobacteraceae bacterium]